MDLGHRSNIECGGCCITVQMYKMNIYSVWLRTEYYYQSSFTGDFFKVSKYLDDKTCSPQVIEKQKSIVTCLKPIKKSDEASAQPITSGSRTWLTKHLSLQKDSIDYNWAYHLLQVPSQGTISDPKTASEDQCPETEQYPSDRFKLASRTSGLCRDWIKGKHCFEIQNQKPDIQKGERQNQFSQIKNLVKKHQLFEELQAHLGEPSFYFPNIPNDFFPQGNSTWTSTHGRSYFYKSQNNT